MRQSVGDDATARLRILATSDLHMHLLGYDYRADRPDPGGSLSRIATLVRQARQEAAAHGAAVLLFDNGDTLQGTPAGEVAAQGRVLPHPMMRAFARMGYDAIGLGNHDFDFGLQALERAVASARCPVICSNLRVRQADCLRSVEPHALLHRSVAAEGRDGAAVTVGVLALLPPQTAAWNAALLDGRVEIENMLSAARRKVEELVRRGADLVVVLAHSGIGGEDEAEGAENVVVPLAAMEGVDAVIGGHSHLSLPGPAYRGVAHVDAEAGKVHGRPVVMPGPYGRHLGVIDLDLAMGADGRWRPVASSVELRPVSRADGGGRMRPLVGEDALIRALARPLHDETRAVLAAPVGRTARPLHSYFSLFAPDRALAVVAAAQVAALRPHLERAGVGGLPVLSAVAPARSGGRSGPGNYTDIPPGPVLRRHVADLCPFSNILGAVIMDGAGLYTWLEQSASLFRTVRPGQQRVELIDPRVPGHDFDVIHGLSWEIDLSQPPRHAPGGAGRADGGRRIVNLCHGGRPVRAGDRFVVLLNSYRANGGGHFTALRRGRPVELPHVPVSEAVAAYLAGKGAEGGADGFVASWRFTPQPGGSVLVRTGPGARAHLQELAGMGVEEDGIDEDGFLRLVLHL